MWLGLCGLTDVGTHWVRDTLGQGHFRPGTHWVGYIGTTQMMERKIQTFFNTCLRCIYKIQWQEKIQNEDLWDRAGQEPVAKQILRRKWGWIRHSLRKPAFSTTRQALTWNPQGKRKRGRPCNSWRRDTEAELKQQGTNWSRMTRTAQNRVQWQGVVEH